jgi:replicative superfamily II helicase
LPLWPLLRLHLCACVCVRMLVQRDNFKIVYVAPMKALAQEVQTKFQEKLKPLGVVVRELTGDMQLTKKEIEATQVRWLRWRGGGRGGARRV